MATLKDIYAILRDMLAYAERKHKEEVESHNDFFEGMWKQVDWPGELFHYYDTCRQSCLFAIRRPEQYEEFMKHARKKFANIPRP